MSIPFNRPFATGQELRYLQEAIESAKLAGDGPFTKRCHAWLERECGTPKALLTHSCTAALEMAALLADLKPGDEVIMPSFTFVSTANAVVLRGAVPVFVDVRPDTLNLNEALIEAAITPRTRAIAPVHYAGVGCEMDAIMAIAEHHGFCVIEDAAQGLGATYRGRALGSIGHFGALSFHETKNVVAGEGGALLVNDPDAGERAEIVREKGTNRAKFFRGQVDKYTWVDVGSSYLPSELTAAFLWAQFEQAEGTTARRLALWERYHVALAPLEARGLIRRPIVPAECGHNAHMYYVLLADPARRDRVIEELKAMGVGTAFHYVPLDTAPAGRRFARAHGPLTMTHEMSERLVRLPLWPGLEGEFDAVLERVVAVLAGKAVRAR